MQDTGFSAGEISLYTAGTTHFTMDVVGYFNPPVAAAPTTQTVSDSGSIAATSSGTVYSPDCPAGYALTGGGCNQGTASGSFDWWENMPDITVNPATRWRCQGNNTNAFAVTVYAYGICAQVP